MENVSSNTNTTDTESFDEYDYSTSFVPDPVRCCSYHSRADCPNYLRYGYDCMGFRFENGTFLQAPWGFGPKNPNYPIGPDFDDVAQEYNSSNYDSDAYYSDGGCDDENLSDGSVCDGYDSMS
ncbi:hypothetical protein QKU48_gp1363 [Fadolivirus algeromassiliense]|jgi:hypothetical protein|uniref:Uncharacterized protein n=1 Tax=Fadolivirus FV1/VV64 TaxID=3070911 RepID=A0A7D3R248_9VIRU|nr:hypothetical protein QKU48_gp1363 [Fadolivirus algeromassiliense]QKF94821.1 hypothetical protein Fadolivirus_1_1363 [Fadolivirus FV1/VV64]